MRIRKFVLGLCAVMMFSGAIVASQGASTVAMAKGLKAPLIHDAGYGENGFKNSTKKLCGKNGAQIKITFHRIAEACSRNYCSLLVATSMKYNYQYLGVKGKL